MIIITFDDDFNVAENLGLKFSLLVEDSFQIFFIFGTWKKNWCKILRWVPETVLKILLKEFLVHYLG